MGATSGLSSSSLVQQWNSPKAGVIGITVINVQTAAIYTDMCVQSSHTRTHTAAASLLIDLQDLLTVQIKCYLAVNVTPAMCALSGEGQPEAEYIALYSPLPLSNSFTWPVPFLPLTFLLIHFRFLFPSQFVPHLTFASYIPSDTSSKSYFPRNLHTSSRFIPSLSAALAPVSISLSPPVFSLVSSLRSERLLPPPENCTVTVYSSKCQSAPP